MRTCAELDQYLLGEMDPETGRAFQLHLESCRDCSVEISRFQVIRNSVREWAKINPAPPADTFKAKRLMRAVESESRPVRPMRFVAAASFACACLLAVGLVSDHFGESIVAPGSTNDPPNDTLAAVHVLYSQDARVESAPQKGVHQLVSSNEGGLVVDTRGARLALSPKSRVRIVAADHLRLQLVQGSVSIQADKRPRDEALIVESDGYEVTVVGTRFQVSRGVAVQLAVTVTEGKVVTSAPSGESHEVAAGDVLSFVGSRPPLRRSVREDEVAQIDNLIEWSRGEPRVSAPAIRRQKKRAKVAAKTISDDVEEKGGTPIEGRKDDISTWRSWVLAGRYNEAEQALRTHLKTHPNETGDWQLLGSLYRKTRAWDEAMKAYARVVEVGGANDANRARFLSAVIAQDHQRQPQRAIHFLEKYLQREDVEKPLEPQAMLRLAKAYQRVGEDSKSNRVIHEVISRFPGTTEAVEAKRLSESR
jgi:hypothetical protein